jgi:hypothetical protein
LLPNPFELDSGVCPDLDGRGFGRRHRLLHRLHQVLSVAHQHLRGLLVLDCAYVERRAFKSIDISEKQKGKFLPFYNIDNLTFRHFVISTLCCFYNMQFDNLAFNNLEFDTEAWYQLKNLPIVNNRPKGESSPNQVTF